MRRLVYTGFLLFFVLHFAGNGNLVEAQLLSNLKELKPFHSLGPSAKGAASWMWGLAWASDGTVSIVDRTPSITYPARPASFGLELVDPLLGYIIPLSSFTAPCSSVDSPPIGDSSRRGWDPDPVFGCPDLCVTGPNRPAESEKWIALVQRGGCPFVEKARQAQNLGAKAVVVGGDRENPDALLNMYSERKLFALPFGRIFLIDLLSGDSSDIQIAATYIKYWDYLELSELIATSNTSHNGLRTLSLVITTEYSAWEWYSYVLSNQKIPLHIPHLSFPIYTGRSSRLL